MATPTSAEDTSHALSSPEAARMARATTGMASLMNVFQIPVTSVTSAICERRKPHERYMA